jgi:membrane associated rhomboid family serine protease
MRSPPQLTSENLKSFSVTAGLALAAVLLSIVRWSGSDVSAYYSDIRAFHGEPWRLVSTSLFHENVVHLAFNCYWLWVFGSSIEAVFGHVKTVGLYLLLAVGSSALAAAAGEDGIGLSGVGYGLFGLLWILSRLDERFRGAIDSQTVGLFVAWFFICIVTTRTGVWRVGNIAHGAGALLGLLTGLAIARPGWRVLCATAVASIILLGMVTGFLWRPYLDWNQEPGLDFAVLGYQAIKDHQPKQAVEFLQRAVEMNERKADWWYNLSVAYSMLGQGADATNAMRHALEIKPGQSDWRRSLSQYTAKAGYDRAINGDHTAAIKYYREALNIDEGNANAWFNLGISYENLGNLEESQSAYERAAKLEPHNPIYKRN